MKAQNGEIKPVENKVIQITSSSNMDTCYALLSDGTIWECYEGYEWRQLPHPIKSDSMTRYVDADKYQELANRHHKLQIKYEEIIDSLHKQCIDGVCNGAGEDICFPCLCPCHYD